MRSWQVGLIFHGIGTPGRELEPGEAPYWITRDHYAGILDRIVALPDPGAIRISFDDGNRSDLDIGLPLLQERGLRAEFFVLTGRIGAPGSLDSDGICALQAAEMSIGSHGIDHRNWAQLSPADLHAEISRSRERLEAICARAVRSAAIPFGAYNARVLRMLARAGYKVVFSSDGGQMGPQAFLRPRTSVRAAMSVAELSAILEARMPLGRRLRRAAKMALHRLI